MEVDYKRRYISAARFDYVKLRWDYAGDPLREEVQRVVDEQFILMQASMPYLSLKSPRYVTLPPSPAKPDGMFIVELFGYAAELVRELPAPWLWRLTYAHVKAYATGMPYEHILKLQELYLSRPARRTATVIRGGSASRTAKGRSMPAIRVGSRKSDWHGVIYARWGFAPGFEGRFRDESLYQKVIAALDYWDQGSQADTLAWSHLLRSLARTTIDNFETDAAQRGFDLEDYLDGFSTWHRISADQMSLGVDEDGVLDPPSPEHDPSDPLAAP